MQLLANPEFVRLRRIKLRPRTMIVLGVTSLAIFGAILALMEYSNTDPKTLYQVYFFTTVGIQLGFGALYALMLSSQNITLERERNTYDFQRLVAMGPWQLGLGKLFGASCESTFGLLGGTLFAFIPVIKGQIPAWAWLESQLVVFMFTFLVTSFGLMCSSMVAKTSYASGLMILFVMFVLPTVIGTMSASGSTVWASMNPAYVLYDMYNAIAAPGPRGVSRIFAPRGGGTDVAMFGYAFIPPLLSFLFMNFIFTALFFVITVRRLADEELSMIRPKHAVIAFAILQVLIIGSSWDEYALTGSSPLHALAAFHMANASVLILLAFGLTPSAELLRGRVSRGRRNDHWSIFFERHNRLDDSPGVCAVLCFGLVYAALALILTWKLAIVSFPAFAIIVMVVAMGIATAALLLYISVYTERGSLKLGGLIVILSLVIPPMIVGRFGAEKVFAISPFAYMGAFAVDANLQHQAFRIVSDNEISHTACPLLCVLLAILLSALAAMRLRFLLDMDEIQRQRDLAKAAKPSDKAVAAARAMLSSPSKDSDLPVQIEANTE